MQGKSLLRVANLLWILHNSTLFKKNTTMMAHYSTCCIKILYLHLHLVGKEQEEDLQIIRDNKLTLQALLMNQTQYRKSLANKLSFMQVIRKSDCSHLRETFHRTLPFLCSPASMPPSIYCLYQGKNCSWKLSCYESQDHKHENNC